MADFKIQRGVTILGATEDVLDVTIDAVDLSKAFVKITNSMYSSSGVNAGDTATKGADDVSAWIEFGSTTQVRVNRFSTAENLDHRVHWEVWEYIGPSGGPNEFLVRDQALAFIVSGTTRTESVTGASDITKVVPIIAAYATNASGQSSPDMAYTAKVLTGTDEVEFERGTSTNRWIGAAAFVEFTGSNWVIEQNVQTTLANLLSNDVPITDIGDWSHAWVELGWRMGSAGNSLTSSSQMWWPHPSDTAKYRAGQGQGAGTHVGFISMGHVIRNDAVVIDHYDSVDGGETVLASGAASPQVETVTISDVGPDTEAVGLVGRSNCDGTGTAYPRQFCGYLLANATQVDWWRGRHGNVREWALSVIRAPITLTPDPVSAGTVAPDNQLNRSLLVGPAGVGTSAPLAQANITLTPDAAIAQGVAPSVSRENSLPVGPAVLSSVAPSVDAPKALLVDAASAQAVAPAPKLEAALTPGVAALVTANPAGEATRVLVPGVAAAGTAARNVRPTKQLVPGVAAAVTASPSVGVISVAIKPDPAIVLLEPKAFLLLIPGRKMIDADLAIANLLEQSLGIAEEIEQEGAIAVTLEGDKTIAPVIDADLSIAQTLQNPAP